MNTLRRISFFASLFLLHCGLSSAASWPTMSEIQASVGIDTSAERIDFSLALPDTRGIPRYLVVCRGGDQGYADALTKSSGINWVPPLMCMLNQGLKEMESSLLDEDSTGPWHSRGQFRWDDLIGACGDYPEFGRVRTFRLRGFQLILEAKDAVVMNGRLSYFKLVVTLRNDPSAQSKVAEHAAYLRPEGDCKNIRKRVE